MRMGGENEMGWGKGRESKIGWGNRKGNQYKVWGEEGIKIFSDNYT